MYTVSALGTILPLVLVHHPILVLYTASIKVVLINVCQLCWVEYGQLITVMGGDDTDLEGKILAAWDVFLMLLTFPKSVHFWEV